MGEHPRLAADGESAATTPTEHGGARRLDATEPQPAATRYRFKRLARFARLARGAGVALRRHGPLTVGRYAVLWIGGRRGYFLRDLLMETPDFRAIADAAPEKSVLCMSGVGHDSMRYRCEHLAEQLGTQGYRADVIAADQVQLTEVLNRYAVFVLHRVMAAPDYLAFVGEARRRGKVVIFDADDLAFDVSALPHLPALKDFSGAERQYLADTMDRNGRMLRACDAVTVSTGFLRDYILKSGAHQTVALVPNAVSVAMLRSADLALAEAHPQTISAPGRGEEPVTIGYFSGTKTHDQDFLEAADALLWALERYPHVRLQIVGHLTLDSRFDRYADRVTRVSFQPWQGLPGLYTAVDINLAPLERDSPFTEAKSCIKYLEAALCKVPTIASPRSDFRRVIAPDVSGLLADTPEEWRSALARLIEAPEVRRRMGVLACDAVRETETTIARAAATCDIYRALAPSAFAAEHVAS